MKGQLGHLVISGLITFAALWIYDQASAANSTVFPSIS